MTSYALVGHFNKETADNITRLWKKLKEENLSDYGFIYEDRKPHITLLDLEAENEMDILGVLYKVDTNAVDISLGDINKFKEGKTMYYDINKSDILSKFQSDLYELFKMYVPSNSFYLPSKWIPHTTIASRLDSACIEACITKASNLEFNDCILNELSILKVNSATEVAELISIKLIK